MPGFVDTHRHTWQAPLPTIACDWTLGQYMTGLHTGLSGHFRPEDTYIGNLLGTVEALDSGITTLLDWSHNLATPEHADAAIAGLRESGARAVFAHGAGQVVKRGGELLAPDRERVRRLAYESRDHIFDQAREVPATADAALGGSWMPHHF